jgi:hypothetical protein
MFSTLGRVEKLKDLYSLREIDLQGHIQICNQQTHHHHHQLRLDGVTTYTVYQHETQHKQLYQYFTVYFNIDFKFLFKTSLFYL